MLVETYFNHVWISGFVPLLSAAKERYWDAYRAWALEKNNAMANLLKKNVSIYWQRWFSEYEKVKASRPLSQTPFCRKLQFWGVSVCGLDRKSLDVSHASHGIERCQTLSWLICLKAKLPEPTSQMNIALPTVFYQHFSRGLSVQKQNDTRQSQLSLSQIHNQNKIKTCYVV